MTTAFTYICMLIRDAVILASGRDQDDYEGRGRSQRRELSHKLPALRAMAMVVARRPGDCSRLTGNLMGEERLAAPLAFVASANTKRLLWGETHKYGPSVVPRSDIRWQLVDAGRFTNIWSSVHSQVWAALGVIQQLRIHIDPPSIGGFTMFMNPVLLRPRGAVD